MKRFGLLLCCLGLLSLCACSEPINKTPYESIQSMPSIDDEIHNNDEEPTNGADTTTAGSSNKTDANTTQSSHTTNTKKTTEAANNLIDIEDLLGDNTTGTKDGTTSKNSTTSTTPTTQPTQQEEVKGVSLPAEGYSPDGKIQIGTVQLTGNTVSMEIKNITTRYETNQDDYFEYTCYDEDGKELKRDRINFGRIYKQQSRVCTFDIPDNTATVELTDLKVEYWTPFV